MKIQLKRSSVLEGNVAKKPTAGQMEYGELAINYNSADPTLFIKDSSNTIIPIAGNKYILDLIEENQQIIVSPSEPVSPTPNSGDLWLDQSECPPELKVYSNCDGSAGWKSLTVNVEKLDDIGDVSVGSATSNQFLQYNGTNWVPTDVDTTVEKLDDIGDVNVGSASANQFLQWNGTTWVPADVDTTIDKLDDIGDVDVDGASTGQYLQWNGTTWVPADVDTTVEKLDDIGDVNVASAEVDDVLSWDGSEWVPVSSGPSFIEPNPGDGNNSINPPTLGAGTEADPYVLTAVDVEPGGSVQTDELISFSNQTPGAYVQFVDQNSGVNGSRYGQPVGVIGADGTWSGKFIFNDVPQSAGDDNFTGLLKIGSSSIYYKWDVLVRENTAIEKPEVLTPPNGAGTGPELPYNPHTSDILNATTEVIDGAWQYPTNGNAGFRGEYYDGKYWVVSGDGSTSQTYRFQHSTDGINWTQVSAGSTNGRGRDIAVGNGRAVIVASSSNSGSTISCTTNAGDPTSTSWTNSNPTTNNTWEAVVFTGTRFVAVGASSGHAGYSDDGLNWTFKSMGQSDSELQTFRGNDLVYADGKVVAIGQDSQKPIAVSEDNGETWVARAIGQGNNYQTGAYNGSRFIAVSANGQNTLYSEDAQYWYGGGATMSTGSVVGTGGGDGRFVVVGKGFHNYSDDGGLTWTYVNETDSDQYFEYCFYGADKFVKGGWYTAPMMKYSLTGTGEDEANASLVLTDDKAYDAAGQEQDTLVKAFEVGDTVTADPSGISGSGFQDGTVSVVGAAQGSNTEFDNPNMAVDGSSTSWSCSATVASGGTVTYTFPVAWQNNSGSTQEIGFLIQQDSGASCKWEAFDSTGVWGDTGVLPNSNKQRIALDLPSGRSFDGYTVTVAGSNNGVTAYTYNIDIDGVIIGDTSAVTSGTVSAVAGTTMSLSNVVGDWTNANKAINDIQKTPDGPTPESITFTSSIPVITAGDVLDWGDAEWQLATNSTYTDGLQEASSPILVDDAIQTLPEGTFNLANDTQYWVRVRYTSNIPDVASEYSLSSHTFKTAAGGGGAIDVALGGLTTLWTGIGGTNPSGLDIVNGVDYVNNDGMVWIKSRSNAISHCLFDTLRGPLQRLKSDETAAEETSGNSLVQFNTDGYNLGNSSQVNYDGYTYAGWNFTKAAGFFDVVEYTGTDANQNIPHELGAEPGFAIIKGINNTANWLCWHKELGGAHLILNSTEAAGTSYNNYYSVDASNISITTTSATVNTNGAKYIAYLFADTPGAIKCGSYTGNGTTQSIDVGFKPQWILHKVTTASQGWKIFDLERGNGSSSSDAATLEPNSAAAEFNSAKFELTDTGFTCHEGNLAINGNGAEYVYVAIAAPTTRYFYDETLQTAVVGAHITQRYGLDPETNDMRYLGIYPLDQQPNFLVDAFVKEGDRYRVIRNLDSEVASATRRLNERDAEIRALRTGFELRLARLETATTGTDGPFAIDGYYPLYNTEAAADAASENGQSHTHEINGTTFYMPDAGTIYHGNYTGEEDSGDSSY